MGPTNTTENPVTDAEIDYKVVIVGGGAAGLCALGRLAANECKDIILVEKADEIGGVWHTTSYPGLTIHTKSFNYKFFDYRPLRSAGEQATKQEVLTYFYDYISENKLADYLRLSSKVTKIVYLADSPGPHKWNVHIQSIHSGKEYVLKCSYVVCALGYSNAGVANVPHFQGQDGFTGNIVHSSDFDEAMLREIAEQEQKVCVYGGGKSAYDLLCLFISKKLSHNVTWVYRKCLWGINYELMYQNSEELGGIHFLAYQFDRYFKMDSGSEKTRELARKLVNRGYYLNVDQDNLDIHQSRGGVYKPHEIELIRQKIERVKAAITGVEKHDILLENGTSLNADYLICATGYQRAANLPLMEISRATGESERYDPRKKRILFRNMIDPRIPSLFIFTAEGPFQQQLFGYSFYAEWLYQFISGKLNTLTNPYSCDAMQTEIDDDDRELKGDYSWCPVDRQHNLSGGIGYINHALTIQYKSMDRTLRDLGCPDDFAMRLLLNHTDSSTFAELNAELRKCIGR